MPPESTPERVRPLTLESRAKENGPAVANFPASKLAPSYLPEPSAAGSLASTTILLLDPVDVNRRWMKGILKAGPYRVLEAKTPEEAWKALELRGVDLIISDIMLPEWGSYDFFRRLKADRRFRLIPVLVLTNVQGTDNEVAVLESGADEFLIKPIQPAVIRARVQTMLRNKRLMDSLDEAEGILFSLAQTIEARDKETGNHCQRLAALSVALGSMLGLPEEDLQALHRGGYLHDIGKIAVPDAILFKKSLLNEEEWHIMRSHTVLGESICRPMKSLAPVLPIIRNHHERWNGSGYPDGLAGEEIPLLARILQIADIYDALTSNRSYKEALSAAQAIEVLTEEGRNGWRDPELVSVFCQMLQQPGFAENSTRLFAVGPALPADKEDRAELHAIRESLARMSRELHR